MRHGKAVNHAKNPTTLTRRQAIIIGAGSLVAFRGTGRLSAATDDARAEILKFTGGKEPVGGRVVIDMPEQVEDGSVVPLTVSVGHSEGSPRAEAILVIAPRNPRPRIVTFHFTPLSGKADATTRIRLAETQSVVAVARMSDGSCFMAEKKIEVTVGGCRPA
jgi:sulfur-oxidizing protein SoxY